MLNKDSPNTQRGAQPAAGTSMTMYALAALLATRSSTALFDQIKAWVTSTNGPEAAALLFQSSGGPGTTEAAYDGPGK